MKCLTNVDQEIVAINYLKIPIHMHFGFELYQLTFYLFDKSWQEFAYICVYSYHIYLFIFRNYA